jgi:uncharacterized SAM-binding protein YcdF (DUF218 family)
LTKKTKKAVILMSFLICSLVALPFVAYILAPWLLWVHASPVPADIIVISGGNGRQRVPVAVEAFHRHLAGQFLITGAEEWQGNMKLLSHSGVSPNLIVAETVSRSTAENASMGVKILREKKVKKAILVTSWYHSRRTLSCFQHYAPEMEFTTASIPSQETEPYKVRVVLLEYIKIAYYVFRFGISPFPNVSPKQG